MSENVLIWLFGILGAWAVMLTAWGMWLTITIKEVRSILILTSKKAAEVLHSPDDHLGIDSLLDKYIEREHELTWLEWGELMGRCDEICSNREATKSERFLAGFLAEVCKHKRKNKI